MKLLAAALAASLVLVGCSSTDDPVAAADPTCAPTPAVDLTQADGWIGQIPALSETTGLIIDNGRGTVVEHRPDAEQPLASAVKVVHLAAYAQAVADGRLNPDEQIPVSDWERWYAGSDGGAHVKALTRLGISNDGLFATAPNATVRLDDMVSAMIQESDNSVPDYLRYRLGDQTLIDAANTGGWTDFELPTLIGTTLGLALGSPPDTDLWALAQRYALDSEFHSTVLSTATLPSLADQFTWFDQHGPVGSAAQLTSFYRSALDGKFGDANDIIRRQLEWQAPLDGFTAMGFKGGNLPGVLTQAFEFTRADGSTATAVWLISGMNEDQYAAAIAGFGNEQLLIAQALNDQDTLERIACAA